MAATDQVATSHDCSEVFLSESERVVFLDRARDSASILFPNPKIDLPDETLPMMDADKFKVIGVDVAWVGYPSIARPHLCFFMGRISAFVHGDDSYLIDGVAINGVSGGPVFARLSGDKPQLLGTVSAYMVNRIRGEALPGLLRVQDVTSFHETIKRVRSIDEARVKQREEEAKRAEEQQREDAAPPGMTPEETSDT
jgi:hypothetical protein